MLETRLRTAGVVAVVRPPAPNLAEALATVLLDAGLGAIEVTFRAAGAPAAIARIRERVPGMLVGAGTVLTADQARDALAAGAEFVVAPGSTAAVIEVVLATGTPMIPGVATPTEVEAALARGLHLLKLFPAEVVGGIAMLRALRGPYPDVRFVPTGGVGAGNLGVYLGEPNVVAVGGSWLTERLDTGQDLELVRRRAVAAAAIVAATRAGVQPPG